MIELADGAVILAHVVEHEPAVVVAQDIVAIDLDHPVEVVQRAIELVQLPPGQAAMMVGLHVPRIEPDQQVIIDDGALEIAGGAIGLAAV